MQVYKRNWSVYNNTTNENRATSTKPFLSKAISLVAAPTEHFARKTYERESRVINVCTYSHVNTRPWTAFVDRRTFRGWMQTWHDRRRAAAAPGCYSARIIREKVRHWRYDSLLPCLPRRRRISSLTIYATSAHRYRRYYYNHALPNSFARPGSRDATRRDAARRTWRRAFDGHSVLCPSVNAEEEVSFRLKGGHYATIRGTLRITVVALLVRVAVACGMRSHDAVHARSRHAERRKSRSRYWQIPGLGVVRHRRLTVSLVTACPAPSRGCSRN